VAASSGHDDRRFGYRFRRGQFLAAPKNPRALYTNQQQLIVTAMHDYMDKYEAWATANFPHANGDAIYQAAKAAQGTMMDRVHELYKANSYDRPSAGSPATEHLARELIGVSFGAVTLTAGLSPPNHLG